MSFWLRFFGVVVIIGGLVGGAALSAQIDADTLDKAWAGAFLMGGFWSGLVAFWLAQMSEDIRDLRDLAVRAVRLMDEHAVRAPDHDKTAVGQ